MTITLEILQHLIQRYDLGQINAEPVELCGGYLHRLWQVKTSQGNFVIKQLMLQTPSQYQTILGGEQIARAMASYYIAVNPALFGSDGIITNIDGKVFLVFKWIEGTVLSLEPASVPQAEQIGSLLAKIHTLNLPVSKSLVATNYAFATAQWYALSEKGKTSAVLWANLINEHLPAILQWCDGYQDAVHNMKAQWVVSHRDLYQPNVVWCDERTPVLIDWENAGIIDKNIELLGVALNWSGQALGKIATDVFKAVLNGYQNVTQQPVMLTEQIFDAGLGSWLNWLKFNMLRSLLKNDWQQLAIQEVINTLRVLHSLQQNRLTILELGKSSPNLS